jgi:AraC-like DNA-binding protein
MTADTSQAELGALRNRICRHCVPNRDVPTAVPGLTLYHLSTPAPVARMFPKPSIVVVVQGEKTVFVGGAPHVLGPGTFFLASLDSPAFALVSGATPDVPYLSLTLDLDLRIVRQMVAGQIAPAPWRHETRTGAWSGRADADLVLLFSRMLQLIDRPAEIHVMLDLLQRELAFRLLTRTEGRRLAEMAHADSSTSRVTKAIEWLTAHYSEPFDVEALARVAGMGVSTLQHHFRRLSSMSPLQYQKSLRLYAARHLMLQEGLDAGSAALRVGYESTAQFNREYKRFFSQPPARDVRALRGQYTMLRSSEVGR